MNNESKVEKMLDETVVTVLGGLTRKWVSPQHSSVPDRILMLPGGIEWKLEVKDFKQQPSKAQYRELMRYVSLDIRCGWVNGFIGVYLFTTLENKNNHIFFHGDEFISKKQALSL